MIRYPRIAAIAVMAALSAAPAFAASTANIFFDFGFPGGTEVPPEIVGQAIISAEVEGVAEETAFGGLTFPGFTVTPTLRVIVPGDFDVTIPGDLESDPLLILSDAENGGLGFATPPNTVTVGPGAAFPPSLAFFLDDPSIGPETGLVFVASFLLASPFDPIEIGDLFPGPTNGEIPFLQIEDFRFGVFEPDNPNGQTFSTFNERFSITAAVPVPAALPLLLGGLGLIAFIARRRG